MNRPSRRLQKNGGNHVVERRLVRFVVEVIETCRQGRQTSPLCDKVRVREVSRFIGRLAGRDERRVSDVEYREYYDHERFAHHICTRRSRHRLGAPDADGNLTRTGTLANPQEQ